MNAGPQTQVDEIAPDIFRMSTWVPDITEQGFTFNQFLLTGDEPFLFHCGHRQLFPFVSEAINRVVPLEKLRWISFGHVEADECGAVNLLLDAAPNAEVIHGALACMVSLIDLCDRPPVVAPEDGVHDIGGHRLRFIPTPHVPHNWEAGLWFDETTSTLLAGDLLTHTGQCPALTESDCVAPALDAEEVFHATGLTTNLGPTLEQLAQLQPTTLAIMHGSSFSGDGAAQLRAPGRRIRGHGGRVTPVNRAARCVALSVMNARLFLAGVLAALALLAGCQSSTVGTPVKSAESPTEPNFPTSRPTRPTAAPPRTLTPAPTSTAVPPGADVLPPENGYVFIETKSGKTRCQLNEEEVGCEAQFANSPVMNGMACERRAGDPER